MIIINNNDTSGREKMVFSRILKNAEWIKSYVSLPGTTKAGILPAHPPTLDPERETEKKMQTTETGMRGKERRKAKQDSVVDPLSQKEA